MNSLPLEAFQLICSYCSLHTLSYLRLVSKDFRDRVDGSLTARRSHAIPSTVIVPRGKHDHKACYIRISLNRQHDPITVVFNRYDPEHNFLEFVHLAGTPAAIEGTGLILSSATGNSTLSSAGGDTSTDFTLGKLDLNVWEEQQKERASSKSKDLSSTVDLESTGPRRQRRSSITEAGMIRTIDHQIEQELARPGPIPPLSQTRPVRATQVTALGSSAGSSSAIPSSNPSVVPPAQGDNYMARFARMVLGSTGASSSIEQTRPGMSAAELAEEARRLFHTVEPEVLSYKKEYKFLLAEGTHYIGDNDFIMRYTVSTQDPSDLAVKESNSNNNDNDVVGQPGETTMPSTTATTAEEQTTSQERSRFMHKKVMFKVDYIRVSWKWISSGALPTMIPRQRAGVRLAESLADPMTLEDLLPDLRVGRIYSARYNRVLQEIRQQEISTQIRGELAMLGYDASILPRDFISVNLRSEPILAWITRETPTKVDNAPLPLQGMKTRDTLDGVDENEDPWQFVESEWSIKQKSIRINAPSVPFEQETEDDLEDQDALRTMVLDLRQNLGQLTGRNILEEMLVNRGYSRELIWKYGFARRGVMGPVPDKDVATQSLRKIIDSEGAR
ncbi:hypothetical protein BGZ83_005724 [Gryganskiella cystojenkinii]|nr:hypothetical protein BGZ83_005724 [Gryganskiella cystojenkinii]